ncbi:hypothetical protein A2955_03570 [Candidatus Woesebacteria bacterium RIFCSPLOWO2_01_FULL_37_19]|uniref:HMA domain-containing protein n=1 Tax=Candidatus Woesebacteria bacterium RIFCSPLOWO2_01_FULL_37_19 TaxID=1802514 RepID=A0A1F8B6Y0_9BACT|nr:MAG: hypothetical protein A2955_03570 [Candidatus Woesebacteria bacterium RIFCSPLOWO2_01_FULL_37_19]
MIYKVYKIQGMDCDACAKMIELDLEDEGFKASCNYAKQTLEVEYKEGNEDENKVKKILANSGYGLLAQ